MERRSQRHIEQPEENKTRKTRINKNQYLYDEINEKIGYEEISNLDDIAKIELSEITNITSIKPKVDEQPETVEIEIERRVYDINSVLEEARKNRIKYDELEKKRKLRENDYATLANANEPKNYKDDIDEEELTNLINTITSHNLVEEIKEAEKRIDLNNRQEGESGEDIFSELLASGENPNEEKTSITPEDEKDIDDSFYTKSMDLSEQDFEFSEELEQERKLKIKITIVVLIIIALLCVIAYFILKQKGII